MKTTTKLTRLGLLGALMLGGCATDRDENAMGGGMGGGGPGDEGDSEPGGDDGETGGGDGDSGAGDDGDIRYDVDPGEGDDDGDNPGDCMGNGGGTPEYEFSVIWIANSRQGTVSKIDTVTAAEQARYYTGPPEDGRYDLLDPSRTSVNLRGDVVVGNRATYAPASSFTKITGDPEQCPDRNGDGVIRTSSGPTDILAWGEDDCVEWNYVVEGNGARAVAWDAGEFECGVSNDPHVWVGYLAWDGYVHVDLVDGSAGTLIDSALVTDPEMVGYGYGIYGGAADKDGNFWGNNNGTVVFVDRQTLDWKMGDGGGYGFALDSEGNPWGDWGSGRVGKTDAVSRQLVDVYEGAQGGYDRGIAVDENEHLWMVTNGPCGVARFDIPTLTWVDDHITWPGCDEPVGVSIDFEGHVWVVDREAENAVKLAPNPAGQGASVVATVTGLVWPYTYSDMTGAALGLVVNPPEG